MLFYIYSSNELFNWLCHDDNTLFLLLLFYFVVLFNIKSYTKYKHISICFDRTGLRTVLQACSGSLGSTSRRLSSPEYSRTSHVVTQSPSTCSALTMKCWTTRNIPIHQMMVCSFTVLNIASPVVGLDWIEQGLTSPPTQYRLSGRQFYRSKDPTNSIKVLKEKLASHRPEEASNPPEASHRVRLQVNL